jgi:hypothetical protein
MRQNRIPLALLISAFVLSCCVPGFGAGVKYKSSGTFADAAGGQHAWSTNDGHTLLWDSEPYIPVGAVFVSQFLAPGAGDDAYQADVKNLEALKAKGITDIVLKSGGPITASGVSALQKMIGYLDANGFTYGIELDDGPKAPLQGYVISPNRYRLEGPSDKTTVTCTWPEADSAIYVIVSKFDNSIKANGGAIVKDGKVTIYLAAPLKSGEVLIVYPRKTLKNSADLWTGYGEYRDRLLAFFKGVKFGRGMRFFVEPFTSKMDFTGEMLGFLPSSSAFRVGFEAYLTRKYKFEGGVNAGWGLNENLQSIELAARLVPLWTASRGVPYAYDMASAHLFSVNPAIASQVWRDILDYRDSSAQEYMNTIADTLRKQVANVPVIFKSSTYHRIYANPYGMGGIDGLAVQAYGTGEAPVDRVAGPIYSLAEESGKSTWFIVAGTQASADGKSPYLGESAMAGTLDSFREIGCKGFFVDNLVSSPEQMSWLAGFKGKIGKNWTDFKPTVINYPIDPATGAYVRRLARDTWWLPTLRKGDTTFIGDGLFAYTILGEGKSYIWTGSGKRVVTMTTGGSGTPSVDFPPGVNTVAKKGAFTLSLDDSPTVLRGVNFTQVFPRETAEGEISLLTQLIPLADKAGIDVKKARGGLESANRVFKNGEAYIAYGIAQDAANELRKALGPDLWMEGEKCAAANFGSVTAAPGASAALALVLDTQEDAPLDPYSAVYGFESTANSSYELWIAGSPPGDSSPASYSVDDGAWTPVSATDGKVDNYGPGLGWYKLGSANLIPGNHTLALRVDSKRTQDNRYYFAIDAIVISPRGFTPNGVVKPF